MLRAKKTSYEQTPLLESQSDLLYEIKGKTLESIAQYFNKFGYYFKHDILTFLNNPITYHGKPDKLELIVIKHLRDTISKYFKILQNQDLPIKYVEDIVFNQIFRGKKNIGQ